MITDFSKLEQEVESSLAEVAELLPVDTPEGLHRRVAWGIREELNELWLEELSPPDASEEALQRIRLAMEGDIAVMVSEDEIPLPLMARSGNTLWRIFSGVGAAALILLCLGLIRFGTMLGPLARPTLQPPGAVELFVQAGELVCANDSFTTEVSEELNTLEQNVTEWQPAPESVEDGLEQLGREIDNLLDDPEALAS